MALLVLDMIWLKERCPPINVVVIIIIICVHCIQGELIAQRYPTLTPYWSGPVWANLIGSLERELHQLTFTLGRWIPTFNLHSEVHFYYLIHQRKHY